MTAESIAIEAIKNLIETLQKTDGIRVERFEATWISTGTVDTPGRGLIKCIDVSISKHY